MALSGVHIVCGFSASDSTANASKQPIFGFAIWSETMLTAGTTAKSAATGANTSPYFRVDTSVEIYLAVGKSPDASQATSVDGNTNTVRYHLNAGSMQDVPANPGDKLAWVLA